MKPYIIVLGNEKGGTGKSTIAMHIAVFLLHKGFKVGTIDIDARQGTFTRYFEHRKASCIHHNIPMSQHVSILKSENENIATANEEEKQKFSEAIGSLSGCDFIIVDTPGNDTFLSRLAHSYADKLVTPLNDSFIDLDVLVRVSTDDVKNFRPSIYSEMVWNQRKERAIRGLLPIDWIIIRNRMTTLYTKNKRDVNVVLEALSKRIGFRLGIGFCERVIFKELFLSGLTLLDIEHIGMQLSMSHVSARQELRNLMSFMQIPNVE